MCEGVLSPQLVIVLVPLDNVRSDKVIGAQAGDTFLNMRWNICHLRSCVGAAREACAELYYTLLLLQHFKRSRCRETSINRAHQIWEE